MSFNVKLGLTIAVALAILGGWYYMGTLGQIGPQRALLFLLPFTVVSLWIFPDVMRKPSDAKTPRHKLPGGNA